MNKVNQAKALRIWLSLGATAALGIALGCGEVGGAGQCNGVDATGACVTIDSIVPTYSGTNTNSVDVVQNPDCDLDPTTSDPEFFGNHSATVAISVTLMPGVTSPPAPAFVEFTGYTIQYTSRPTNLVTAPPLTTQSFGPNNWKVNADGTSLETTLEFVNTQTKTEYINGNGSLMPSGTYTATYTITGTTQFGQDVVLTGSQIFSIGNFDFCS